MIHPIGRLWCEACSATRLFVVLAEASAQIDPHACQCDECGFGFGDRGYVVHEEIRNGERITVTRTVLDPRVLAAARERYQDEAAARLLEVGTSATRDQAQIELARALDNPDLKVRRALVEAPGPKAMDPKLAQRVLDPRNRRGPGKVE